MLHHQNLYNFPAVCASRAGFIILFSDFFCHSTNNNNKHNNIGFSCQCVFVSIMRAARFNRSHTNRYQSCMNLLRIDTIHCLLSFHWMLDKRRWANIFDPFDFIFLFDCNIAEIRHLPHRIFAFPTISRRNTRDFHSAHSSLFWLNFIIYNVSFVLTHTSSVHSVSSIYARMASNLFSHSLSSHEEISLSALLHARPFYFQPST